MRKPCANRTPVFDSKTRITLQNFTLFYTFWTPSVAVKSLLFLPGRTTGRVTGNRAARLRMDEQDGHDVGDTPSAASILFILFIRVKTLSPSASPMVP
jgi:hypothetical protein